jgi:hypothetical protein
MKNYKNIKIGTKVKVVGNKCSHTYEIGKTYEVYTKQAGTSDSHTCILKNSEDRTGNNIYLSDLEITSMTKTEIEENIVSLENNKIKIDQEISLEKSKISYLEETGLTEINEDEFKVYGVLKTLKQDLTDIERAKIIAQLINQ